MQLDNELLALEAQLANFRPRERVDFGEVLKDDKAGVSNGQLQRNAFVVLNTQTLLVMILLHMSSLGPKRSTLIIVVDCCRRSRMTASLSPPVRGWTGRLLSSLPNDSVSLSARQRLDWTAVVSLQNDSVSLSARQRLDWTAVVSLQNDSVSLSARQRLDWTVVASLQNDGISRMRE